MKMLNILPFSLLKAGNLGYYAEVDFCHEISDYIDRIIQKEYKLESYQWNMIVGTYDEKQKIVVQCFNQDYPNIFFKIGNENSAKEMTAEIDFLAESPKFCRFDIPEILSSQTLDKNHQFNIQVTKEFLGNKVEPVITVDIYKIFQEISAYKNFNVKNNKKDNIIPHSFSHGDFAPWNLKLNDNRYIVFDWEHCGIRFYGFDLIHYVFQIENLLNGKSIDEAVDIAVTTLKRYDKDCILDKETLKYLYFEECKKSY